MTATTGKKDTHMKLRVETKWPEAMSGWVFAAIFNGGPSDLEKDCCECKLCEADAWVVADEIPDDLTAEQMAQMIVDAISHQAAAALEGRNKRAELVKAGWIRAAEEAFAGDMGALRNRVALAKEGMPEFTEQQLLGPDRRNGSLTNTQIKYMVDRFLGWRLPKPWHPDNGISYARPNYAHAPADHDWPNGTNLFDAGQAEAMVRYMLEGIVSQPTAPAESGPGEERPENIDELVAFIADAIGTSALEILGRERAHQVIMRLYRAFAPRLTTADGRKDRDELIEQCAIAARMVDRVGREWVKGSLWDNITQRAADAVRQLKSKPRATERGGEKE